MICFPPFRLDPVDQSIWKHGASGETQRLALTPRAFAILQHLIQNAGRLVTHDELLSVLWPDRCVQPEVLKAHINAIRSVLEDEARCPRFVETERGRGYRFVATVESMAVDPNMASGSALDDTELVGRQVELGKLHKYYGDAHMGIPQVVFISGEMGCGKSALVRQFIKDLPKSGIVTAIGHCIEGYGGQEPYYPVLSILAQLSCRAETASVLKPLASLAPTWASYITGYAPRLPMTDARVAGPDTSKRPLLHEISLLIARLAQDRPVVLVIEDAHLSDYSTVDWISASARGCYGAKLMIIVTYRAEDAGLFEHPIDVLHQDLFMRKLCREIRLGNLTEQDICTYVRKHSPIEEAEQIEQLAKILAERSSGNASFVGAVFNEIVQHRSDQRLNIDQGSIEKSDFTMQVPTLVGRVIEHRISHLSHLQQRILEAASLAGPVFSVDVAAHATGISAEEIEDVCEALCRHGFVITRAKLPSSFGGISGQVYAFRQELYRQVFYERQSPIKRARLKRLVDEAAQRDDRLHCDATGAAVVIRRTQLFRSTAS